MKKIVLLLALFLGGCTVAPERYLKALIGDGTGIDDVDNPTMSFTVAIDAKSLVLRTTTYTNTLYFTGGDYWSGTYEGAGYKFEIFDTHTRGGSYKLYTNGTLVKYDDFTWWDSDIDLNPQPDPGSAPTWAELATGKTICLEFENSVKPDIEEVTFASGGVSTLFYQNEEYSIKSSSSQEVEYYRRDFSSNYEFYFNFYEFDEAGGKVKYSFISPSGESTYQTGTFTFVEPDNDDDTGGGSTGDNDDDLEAWIALVGGKTGTYYHSQYESYPVSFSENAEEFDMGTILYTLTEGTATATSATYYTGAFTIKISVTSESGGTIEVVGGSTYSFTFD